MNKKLFHTVPVALAILLAASLALTACGGGKTEAEVKPAAEKSAGKEGEHGDKDAIKLSEDEARRAGIKLETLRDLGVDRRRRRRAIRLGRPGYGAREQQERASQREVRSSSGSHGSSSVQAMPCDSGIT
jgi:hypothetical protein